MSAPPVVAPGPGRLDLDDLVDHHCHGVLLEDLERAAFERLMNEGTGAAPLGTTPFDSMLGLALRRHCAPLLDLEPMAPADVYLRRRRELGGREASRRLLSAAGLGTLLVDTGLGPPGLTSAEETAELCGGVAHEVVRLERLTEQVLAAGCPTCWARWSSG